MVGAWTFAVFAGWSFRWFSVAAIDRYNEELRGRI
jgi:hypothetical protein